MAMKTQKGTVKEIQLTVNGRPCRVEVPANMSLQRMLKESLLLTGTKRGCARGECGGCTVLFDGKPVNACLTLAIECDGAEIRTIEGEATDGALSDLQRAFVEHGAIQCGFCTPGMIMSARALLERNPRPSNDQIVEAIAGNLCRCTGYEAIVNAIASVAEGTKTKPAARAARRGK